MAIFATIVSLLAAGGSDLVLLFSALGGLSGVAAIATVWVQHRSNKAKVVVDTKSVAISELEKAVPGMGEIIEQWQGIVHQLQTDNAQQRTDLAECRSALAGALARIAELEGKVPKP